MELSQVVWKCSSSRSSVGSSSGSRVCGATLAAAQSVAGCSFLCCPRSRCSSVEPALVSATIAVSVHSVWRRNLRQRHAAQHSCSLEDRCRSYLLRAAGHSADHQLVCWLAHKGKRTAHRGLGAGFAQLAQLRRRRKVSVQLRVILVHPRRLAPLAVLLRRPPRCAAAAARRRCRPPAVLKHLRLRTRRAHSC